MDIPTTTPQPLPELLRLQDVCSMLALARSTVYTLLTEDPSFPPPVRVTRRAIRWRRIDIEQWARTRPAARPPRPERKKTAV